MKMMIIQMNAEKCNELKTNAEKYQQISNVDNDNDDNDKNDDNTNKCREIEDKCREISPPIFKRFFPQIPVFLPTQVVKTCWGS